MIEGVTHAHLGPIWYHSEHLEVPYSPNQFLGWDFFCRFLQQTGSRAELVDKRKIQKGLDETHPYHNIHRCNQPAKAWGSVQFFFECHLNVHDILTLTIRYISGSHSIYIRTVSSQLLLPTLLIFIGTLQALHRQKQCNW